MFNSDQKARVEAIRDEAVAVPMSSEEAEWFCDLMKELDRNGDYVPAVFKDAARAMRKELVDAGK